MNGKYTKKFNYFLQIYWIAPGLLITTWDITTQKFHNKISLLKHICLKMTCFLI